MTSLTIKAVEYGDAATELPERTTLTMPLPERDVADAISNVVARADEDYALDLITMLQVKARIAEDKGERLSLDEFARLEGWGDDLAQLRSE